MAVDPKDREAYERAKEDSKLGFVPRFIQDQVSYWVDSDSERAAYQKGSHGEQLDEDKKDK